MGNDTVGSIMVGPRDFTTYEKMGALDQLNKLLTACKDMQARLKAGDEELEDVIEDPELKGDKSGNVHAVLARIADECGSWDDAMDELIEMLSPTPESFLDEFVAAWRGSDHRDVMMRKLPGNDDRMIVVGAIQTWGDPPHHDTATWLFWRAALLDIFPILRIE